MKNGIDIIIADDHPFYPDGLMTGLRKINFISSVRKSLSGKQALELMEEHEAGIIFMDMRMPGTDSIEAAKHILEKFPPAKIAALSEFYDKRFITAVKEAGVCGCILKSACIGEIEHAMREMMSGRHYYSPGITDMLLAGDAGKNTAELNNEYPEDSEKELVESENKILNLICEEKSLKEIALLLLLTEGQVKYRHSRLLLKTGAKNEAGLVKYAIASGLYINKNFSGIRQLSRKPS